MRLLLDVNVLVALLDEGHVHHSIVQALVDKPKLKIATCALTENGVLRIMNLPAYSSYGPVGFKPICKQLQQLCKDLDHEYWPCDISLRDEAVVQWDRIMGHNQITDVYLLALAVKHKGALATLDHRVAFETVRGAQKSNLVVL
jgi:uncharacterized protein